MKFIKWLLGLCDHKWTTVAERPQLYPETKAQWGTKYVLQCDKCGNVKAKTL